MKEYLFKHNIPPKQFACDLNISVSYFYQLLRGERKPSLELAQKIEEYTDGAVTVMQLLGITEEWNDQTIPITMENRLHILEETVEKIEETIEQMEWRISKLED